MERVFYSLLSGIKFNHYTSFRVHQNALMFKPSQQRLVVVNYWFITAKTNSPPKPKLIHFRTILNAKYSKLKVAILAVISEINRYIPELKNNNNEFE